MKKIYLFLFLLTPTFINAQIREYFLPSEEYFGRIFKYETDEIENENGKFIQKSDVIYELDKSGNYKRTIKRRMFTYGIFNHEETLYQYYNINDDVVTLIYSKGILTGFFNLDPFRKDCILKYPPAKWSDNSDPDVTENFESKMGILKNEYGEYECIIVTVTYKAKSPSVKYIENERMIYYYARGLGLVKNEHLVIGDKNDNTLIGTLIDNFSSSSYYVKKEKELEEKKRLEILKEREIKTYSLSEYKNESYEQIKISLANKILRLIDPKEKIDFSIELNLTRKYNGKTEAFISFEGDISPTVKQKIELITSITELPLLIHETYHIPLNTIADFSFNCKTTQQDCIVSNLDRGYVLKGDEKTGKLIISDINMTGYNAKGTYETIYNTAFVNNESITEITYLSFEGLGGSSNALLSLFVPGLGRHFVNDTKNYPWLVTLGSLTSIGAGVYLKLESNRNYDLYHSFNYNTPQDRINEYYEQANSQHQQAIGLIAIGAAIWIYDIIWTAQKGAENKKENKKIQKNFSFHPVLSDKKQIGLGITYNF